MKRSRWPIIIGIFLSILYLFLTYFLSLSALGSSFPLGEAIILGILNFPFLFIAQIVRDAGALTNPANILSMTIFYYLMAILIGYVINKIRTKISSTSFLIEKKTVFYGLLIVLLVFTAAQSSYAAYQSSGKYCDNFLVNDKQLCLKNLARQKALSEKDESYCATINDKSSRNICYREVASAKLEITICSKIADYLTKELCIYDVAKGKNDSALCEKMASPNKYECIAVITADASVCGMIHTGDGPFYNDPNGDPRTSYSNDFKDRCYYGVAVKTKDVSFCSKIKTNYLRSYCLNVEQ